MVKEDPESLDLSILVQTSLDSEASGYYIFALTSLLRSESLSYSVPF